MPQSLPFAHVTIVHTLALVLLGQLLGAAFLVLAGRRVGRRVGATVSIGGAGASLVAVAYHAWILATLPAEDRALLHHVFRMVRFGQLDASFELYFDPLAAVTSALAAVVVAFSLAFVWRSDDKAGSRSRLAAFCLLALAGVQVAALADNFVTTALGWGTLSVCGWGIAASAWTDGARVAAGMRAFLFGHAADVLLVIGFSVLYWGTAGAWQDRGFTPDLSPRIVAVRPALPGASEDDDAPPPAIRRGDDDDDEEAAPAPIGSGFLTLTSYAGAVVYMDESRTPLLLAPDTPLRAPFVRFPVRAGPHAFRVHPGGGVDDYLVTQVVIRSDREMSLLVVGPTLTFRELRDQVEATSTRPSRAWSSNRRVVDEPLRASLAGRKVLEGVPLLPFACLVLFVAAAMKSAQVPFHVWLVAGAASPAAAMGVVVSIALTGVHVMARLDFVLVLSNGAPGCVAVLGGIGALVAGVLGLRRSHPGEVLAHVVAAEIGVCFVALGAGAPTASVLHTVTLALGSSALFAALLCGSFRGYSIAALGLTGIPLLSGFWSKHAVVAAALTSDALGPVARGVAVASLLVAFFATSVAVWRVFFVAFPAPHEEGAGDRVVVALGVVAAGAGLVLGASKQILAGEGESLLAAWLVPFARHVRVEGKGGGAGVAWGAAILVSGAALAGWASARARYARRARGHALATPPRIDVDDAWRFVIVRGVLGLRSLVGRMDAWVVDGIANGLGVLVRAVAWLDAAFDALVVGRASHTATVLALRVATHLRAWRHRYLYFGAGGVAAALVLEYLVFGK